MNRVGQIHIGKRIQQDMAGAAEEGRRTACVNDASTACVRLGALGDTLIPCGVLYATATGCKYIAGQVLQDL